MLKELGFRRVHVSPIDCTSAKPKIFPQTKIKKLNVLFILHALPIFLSGSSLTKTISPEELQQGNFCVL
jgi:hypothetical protein